MQPYTFIIVLIIFRSYFVSHVSQASAADLQAVPLLLVHVQVADCVLQAGLGAALRDGLGNGVHVKLGDLRVVVGATAHTWTVPDLLLFRSAVSNRNFNTLWTKLNY